MQASGDAISRGTTEEPCLFGDGIGSSRRAFKSNIFSPVFGARIFFTICAGAVQNAWHGLIDSAVVQILRNY
jgi:hypothetical protein